MTSRFDKHGGPAFPTNYFYDQDSEQEVLPMPGMTLRDYFAAKAMQGLLSSPRAPLGGKEDVTDLLIAKLAYVAADAMLKAREQ